MPIKSALETNKFAVAELYTCSLQCNFPMRKNLNQLYTRQCLFLLCPLLVVFSCSEKKLNPEDVEYRKDENGSEILFELSEDEPYGKNKRSYVTEKYSNGGIRFTMGFVNGLKDGNFSFWQNNGLPELNGFYSSGKRNGTFTAYGKIGEIIYQKNFREDKLDGNFTLYYPASNSDALRFFDKLYEVRSSKSLLSWKRIKKMFSSGSVDPLEIKVKNHLRLQAQFKDDFPTGPYKAYFHPGTLNLTLDELLREEGEFSKNEESKGFLVAEQRTYFPRTSALVVVLPDGVRLETLHPATTDGFSRAIDEATKVILEIPAYRNPDKNPALVYTIDDRGNEIVPIWSSDIKRFAIRNLDGYLLEKVFQPTYEAYVNEALVYAQSVVKQLDTSNDPKVSIYEKNGASVDVVGLDESGSIIDVFWSSRKSKNKKPLEKRIFAKRVKILRGWENGISTEADWLLNNGSKLFLRGKSSPTAWVPPSY